MTRRQATDPWHESLAGQTWRTAHRTHCPHCHAPVWQGLDNDRTALNAQTDTQPLNAAGE